MYENPHIYGDGSNSSVGTQFNPFYYYKKAIVDTAKDRYFGQLANVRSMPKHFGKTMKQYQYIPLLDDRNINDQGIDATGTAIANEVTIKITTPDGYTYRAVGNGTDAATALTKAQTDAQALFKSLKVAGASYAASKTDLTAKKWIITEGKAVNSYGNLWGSSKDIGYITGKLPTLSETGGRVNRVGFSRVEIEGNIEDYGFFDEYTEDAINFDTDEELFSHITSECMKGANEIVEGLIQIDLINGAGVVLYGGEATSNNTITGETGVTASVLNYDMLTELSTILNDNRCPKDTEIITGSRFIDTRVVGSARYVYLGSALKKSLMKMKDYHNDKAYLPVQTYANAGTIARGEVGSIDNFRFIEVPEMYQWSGAGATVTSNNGYRETDGKYNIYPCLVVGSGSFSTIGFQTDGKNVKFKIIHKKPGEVVADRSNPYGKVGFYSIQWWYGSIITRPEWIAVMKVVAEM